MLDAGGLDVIDAALRTQMMNAAHITSGDVRLGDRDIEDDFTRDETPTASRKLFIAHRRMIAHGERS
jgi:hypothetical protein